MTTLLTHTVTHSTRQSLRPKPTTARTIKGPYVILFFVFRSFFRRIENTIIFFRNFLTFSQSYIYQVLQTIQMKLILLCVWAEPAVLGSAKTALKIIYKIQIGYYSLVSWESEATPLATPFFKRAYKISHPPRL